MFRSEQIDLWTFFCSSAIPFQWGTITSLLGPILRHRPSFEVYEAISPAVDNFGALDGRPSKLITVTISAHCGENAESNSDKHSFVFGCGPLWA